MSMVFNGVPLQPIDPLLLGRSNKPIPSSNGDAPTSSAHQRTDPSSTVPSGRPPGTSSAVSGNASAQPRAGTTDRLSQMFGRSPGSPTVGPRFPQPSPSAAQFQPASHSGAPTSLRETLNRPAAPTTTASAVSAEAQARPTPTPPPPSRPANSEAAQLKAQNQLLHQQLANQQLEHQNLMAQQQFSNMNGMGDGYGMPGDPSCDNMNPDDPNYGYDNSPMTPMPLMNAGTSDPGQLLQHFAQLVNHSFDQAGRSVENSVR